MTASTKEPSLTEVATALEQELQRFEQRVELAQRLRLTSEKNLERAAQAVQEASALQERVVGQVRALIEALTAARARQEAQAQGLQERAEEIVRRRGELLALRARFEQLGDEARAINAFLQEGAPADEDGGDARPLVARLREAEARMEKVAEGTGAIGASADAAGLEEVSRQADGLRQQILAARNKVHLTLQKLS